jgi:hypothetical protein
MEIFSISDKETLMSTRRYVWISCLVLPLAAAVHAADDSTLAGDQARAASDAVKQQAKIVADAAKDGAKQVASAAKGIAHEVATASKQGAQQIAATAKQGAEKAKAAVNGEKPASPAINPPAQ